LTISLVLTAGSWSSRLLNDLSISLHPKRRVLHWYEVEKEHLHDRMNGPGFLITRGSRHVYGFPAIQQTDGQWLVKAGFHYAPYFEKNETPQNHIVTNDHNNDNDSDVDPDTVIRTVTEEEGRESDKFIRELFQGIGRRVKSAVCLYTMTNDGHFILDQHPKYPNVIIATGFSGHGFKFGLTVGKIIMSLVLGQSSGFDLSHFSIRRDAIQSPVSTRPLLPLVTSKL